MNTTVRHGGIYVKAIIPKGAAELDGRIQKGMKSRRLMRRVRTTQKVHLHPFLCLHRSGDRVVAVNGKSLDGATHQQAVEALRDTGQVRDDFNHQHQAGEAVQPDPPAGNVLTEAWFAPSDGTAVPGEGPSACRQAPRSAQPSGCSAASRRQGNQEQRAGGQREAGVQLPDPR